MTKTKSQRLKKCTLLQLYARAQAPCRDYYGLTIGETCISLNSWKITHGPHVFPKEKFSPIEDIKYDKYMQEEIRNIFGANVFQYIIDLGNNKRKLENLPSKLFLHVLKYLGVNDVLHLAVTSKIFYELCNTETVWCMMFKKILNRNPSNEEKRMAFDCGWRDVLKRRMAFIKKTFSETKLRKKKPPVVAPKKNLIKAK